MNPTSSYAQTYIPQYFSKLTKPEKALFVELFDNPLNKYVENIRKLQPTGLYLEEKLAKMSISLSDTQDRFLDDLDAKYFDKNENSQIKSANA